MEEFLKQPCPEKFDFKDLMKQHYRERFERMKEALETMSETEDTIKKWYLYRTADEELGALFDCDRCDLTMEIYNRLWGELGNSFNLGPDTVNSFATLFNRGTGRSSFRDSYADYPRILEPQEKKLFEKYAKSVGLVGNYVLVPRGYNRYRGGKETFEDDWGPSLDNLLRNTDGRNWLPAGLCPTQYINRFFLWDYTQESGDGYMVKPVFLKTKEPGEIIPHLNDAILSRGEFMVKMLCIALYEPDRYTQLMDRLTGKEKPILEDTSAAKEFLGL